MPSTITPTNDDITTFSSNLLNLLYFIIRVALYLIIYAMLYLVIYTTLCLLFALMTLLKL